MNGNVWVVKSYFNADYPSIKRYYQRYKNAERRAKSELESYDFINKTEICLVNAVYSLDDDVCTTRFIKDERGNAIKEEK